MLGHHTIKSRDTVEISLRIIRTWPDPATSAGTVESSAQADSLESPRLMKESVSFPFQLVDAEITDADLRLKSGSHGECTAIGLIIVLISIAQSTTKTHKPTRSIVS